MTEVTREHYWEMRHEVRIAQRLCERTARLYRRAHAIATFLNVLGGTAAISASASWSPAWLPPVGVLVLAAIGAASLAVRPAEKAALAEADVRKYAELQTEGNSLDDKAFAAALSKARVTDVPDIEPLRDVAYNDVMREIGRPELAAPLRIDQRLLAMAA